jgi:hypothetical protein
MGTDGSDSQAWYVRTFIALTLFVGTALAAPVSDSAALAMTRPKEQIVAKDITPVRLAALLKPVDAFYGFWVNGSPVLLARAIGSDFVDHTLPPGRPQAEWACTGGQGFPHRSAGP